MRAEAWDLSFGRKLRCYLAPMKAVSLHLSSLPQVQNCSDPSAGASGHQETIPQVTDVPQLPGTVPLSLPRLFLANFPQQENPSPVGINLCTCVSPEPEIRFLSGPLRG